MNKRVLISAITVLSIAMVIGIASVGNKVASSLNIVKASPELVEHNLVMHHSELKNVSYDEKLSTYNFEIKKNTDASNVFSSTNTYGSGTSAYVSDPNNFDYSSNDYIFKMTETGEHGHENYFNITFIMTVNDLDYPTLNITTYNGSYNETKDVEFTDYDFVGDTESIYFHYYWLGGSYGSWISINYITFHYFCLY